MANNAEKGAALQHAIGHANHMARPENAAREVLDATAYKWVADLLALCRKSIDDADGDAETLAAIVVGKIEGEYGTPKNG